MTFFFIQFLFYSVSSENRQQFPKSKMGHQSYAVAYTSEEEKTEIIRVILKHNADTDWDNRGEDIEQICDARYEKLEMSVILFGNGGGRRLTFGYLYDEGLRVLNFSNLNQESGQPDEVPSLFEDGVWKMNPNNTEENRREAREKKERDRLDGMWGSLYRLEGQT